MHGLVRERRRRVHGTQDEIVLLGLGIPPLMPGRAEGFASCDQRPEFGGRFGTEVFDQRCEDGVAFDVAHVEVVEPAERAGEVGHAAELVGAWVGGFEAPQVGFEVVAAIGVEELRGEIQPGEGGGVGRGCDFGHGVAGLGECRDGGVEGTFDGWCWGDDAWRIRMGCRGSQRETYHHCSSSRFEATCSELLFPALLARQWDGRSGHTSTAASR